MKLLIHRILGGLLLALLLGLAAGSARAQADLQVYGDSLVNGFADWGWGSTRNFA